jgi:hypothetical protein
VLSELTQWSHRQVLAMMTLAQWSVLLASCHG